MLTSRGVSLTQVAAGEEVPTGTVAQIADAVLPAVVSIQVTLGQDAGTGSGVVIDGEATSPPTTTWCRWPPTILKPTCR